MDSQNNNTNLEFDQCAIDAVIDNENNPQDIDEQEVRVKKFVIEVQEQYIEYIEHLSRDQRNEVINHLIEESFIRNEEDQQAEVLRGKLNIAIIALITMVVGFPIILWLLNTSMDLTESNYKGMQHNFHKLYNNRGR